MTFQLGIDFGTSTTVAVLRAPDGRIRPLVFDGSELLPSAVCAFDDGTLLVGRDALHAAKANPAGFEPNPKRSVDDGVVLLGGREIPVVTLFAAVLGRVAAEAARVAGGPVEAVTLTCPAGWGARRRESLTAAAAAAGLAPPTLVAEPVAATGYFVEVFGGAMPVGACVVVYDFGAGTFDASVVRRSSGGFDVLAERGLPDAGGLDIDAAVTANLGTVYAPRDPAAWDRLMRPTTVADRRAALPFRDDVRAGKEILSRSPSTYIHVPLIDDDALLTRSQIEQLARPILDRTVRTTLSVLREARVGRGEVAGLFLVGGSSRIPLVATLLHQELGLAPTVMERPELVVAEGSLHVRPAPPADATLVVPAGPVSSGPPASSGAPAPSAPPVASGARATASVPMPMAPSSGAPVSGVPVSAAPASGAPVSGMPVSGMPVSGMPSSGAPVSAMPVSAAPVSTPPGPRPPSFGPPPAPPVGPQVGPPVGSLVGSPGGAPVGPPSAPRVGSRVGPPSAPPVGPFAAARAAPVPARGGRPSDDSSPSRRRPWWRSGWQPGLAWAVIGLLLLTFTIPRLDFDGSGASSGSDGSGSSSSQPRADMQAVTNLSGHSATVWAMAFSPDGTKLASAGGDNTVRLWDVPNGKSLGELQGHRDAVRAVRFSADGRTLMSADAEGRVVAWNLTTMASTFAVSPKVPIKGAVALSPDGTLAAGSAADGNVSVWTAATGEPVAELSNTGGMDALAFSPNGRLLAGGRSDGVLAIWAAPGGQVVAAHRVAGVNRVVGVAFSPDSQAVVAGSDEQVRLWSASAAQTASTVVAEHPLSVFGLAFDPTGTLLLSADSSGMVRLRNKQAAMGAAPNSPTVGGGGIQENQPSVNGGVGGGTAVPDSTGSAGNGISDARPAATPGQGSAAPAAAIDHVGYTNSAYSVAFSPDGRTFAVGTSSIISLWRVP